MSDDKQPPLVSGSTREAILKELGNIQEFGGPKGPEPTRYGDWQTKGRVSDF